MRELFLGEYIKRRRLALGLTQEDLCEGICDPTTISRLENGRQTPARNRINALLQRLDLPDDRYFALLSQNEADIQNLQEEIHADIIRFERAAPEDLPKIRAEGLKKLEELEQIAEKDDHITRQYILSNRAVFGRPDGPYSPEEQLDVLLEALRLTIPSLNPKEINLGWYSMEETGLLNQIANTYVKMGQRKKAIDIYHQLLEYVQEHNRELNRYAGHYSMIAMNYGRTLSLEKRYDDAMEVLELGRKACVEYPHYQFLPGLLEHLGGCYFYKGDLETCKEYYREAYALYRVTGNEQGRISLEKNAKELLGLEFPF